MRRPRPSRSLVAAAAAALSVASAAVLPLAASAADTPTTAPATAPATGPSASASQVTPEAAAVLTGVKEAYGKLNSLQLVGKISGDFDVDGQKDNQSADFTSTFAAPNKFRHEMQQDALMGSTGDKLYIYTKGRNAYMTAEAPKAKVLSPELPEPFGELLGAQNLSLALAMAPDASAELKQAFGKIAKGADVKVGEKSYTALNLSPADAKAVTTLLIDPATHLLRRATIDLAPELLSRGAQDVKRAVVTIDYTTTTADAKVPAEQFAWAPPAGAKDAKEMADSGGGAGGEAAQLEGKPAPAFKLKDLEGKDVALADLKGQVVVLDFWATWCGPCVASLPKIDKLSSEMKDKGVKVFAVNEGEDKELVQGFMKSKNLTLPVLLDGDSKVGEAYKASAIPETVVIGKDGVVRKVFVGAGPDTEKEIRAAVEEALKAAK